MERNWESDGLATMQLSWPETRQRQSAPRIPSLSRANVSRLAGRTAKSVVRDRVAVLGAGNGGLALAGYLAQRGQRVSLWNRSVGSVASVRMLGGIRVGMPGAAPRFASVSTATCDMRDALAGARVILVAVPASAHADIARRCGPYLRDGQTILLLPGRTGGALEFRRVLQESGFQADVLLGEANTFPFAARCVGPAQAVIFGTKTELLTAAAPANRTAKLIAACRPFLPMLVPARSVLETGLANLGAILHPTITLLNAGRIERGESFDFYTEGVTAAVAATLADADAERLAIARAYGVPAISLVDWVEIAYGHRGESIQAAIGDNPAYSGIKAPNTLRHRYQLPLPVGASTPSCWP